MPLFSSGCAEASGREKDRLLTTRCSFVRNWWTQRELKIPSLKWNCKTSNMNVSWWYPQSLSARGFFKVVRLLLGLFQSHFLSWRVDDNLDINFEKGVSRHVVFVYLQLCFQCGRLSGNAAAYIKSSDYILELITPRKFRSLGRVGISDSQCLRLAPLALISNGSSSNRCFCQRTF